MIDTRDQPAPSEDSQIRHVVTEIPGPRSRELAERSREAISSALSSVLPVYVASASGGVLKDVDGNSFIDFSSGIAVTGVGNSAPNVVDRVTDQLSRFTHSCAMVAPYSSYVEVCERLNALTPGDHAKRSILFTTGAEAVENAVKIARFATGRDAVVVLDHAYHGRTLLTMAMTARNVPYKDGFGPFAPEVYRVACANPFRWPTGPKHCAEEAAAAVIDQIETQIGSHRVAAVVVEPIQGEGGFVVPAPGFLPALQSYCQTIGAVFVADEVQTGMARTGDYFACQHEGLVPDLIVLAKGLGGGLPISAVTGKPELLDAVPPGGLGGTYSGNPLSCAAALGVIDTIEEQGLVERARGMGETALTRLRQVAADLPVVGDVRGRGAMIALEFVEGKDDLTPNRDAMLRVVERCHQAGLLVLTAGTYGNVLRLLPPLVMPDDLLNEGLDVLEQALIAG